VVKRQDGMLSDLDVEVDNVLFVHVLKSVADLPHVANHFRLGHLVVFVGNLVKQLSARQATTTHANVRSAGLGDG